MYDRIMGPQDYKIYTEHSTLDRGKAWIDSSRSQIEGFKLNFQTNPISNKSWREIWLEDLTKMYKTYSDINILLSGGSDSILVTYGFLECGFDVNHTIVLFKDYDHICNAREVTKAFELAGKYRIKFDILEIQVRDFFEEWLSNINYQNFTSIVMDTTLQCYILTKVDKKLFTIVSESGFPNWSLNTDNEFEHKYNLDQLLIPEFFYTFDINGNCRPFNTSPDAISSFFCGEEAHSILDKNILNLKTFEKTCDPKYKYRAWTIMSGFDIEKYYVPKTSVQMFDNHKFQKRWHRLMSSGELPIAKNNTALLFPLKLFQDKIKNNQLSEYWIDYNDWKADAQITPWYG